MQTAQRLGRAAFVVIAALLAGLLAPTTAHADATATVEAGWDQVEPGLCNDYDIYYDLGLPEGATSWNARIAARGSGEDVTSAYYNSPVGSVSLLLCDGAFRRSRSVEVTVTGGYIDATGVRREITGGGTITFKPAKARVTFRATPTNPRHGQPIRFNTSVRALSNEYGLLPIELASPNVQARRPGGQWRGTDAVYFTSDEDGRDSFRGRWTSTGTWQLRAVFPAQYGMTRAVSPVVTIRTR